MILIDLPILIKQCAPLVAISTMTAIVKTESKINPWAIGLNGHLKLKYQPNNLHQAALWVDYLESHHYNFDVGLTQVNIQNIHYYGYKARDLLDPCINLKVASKILQKNYYRALPKSNSSQEALRKAISSYNTGNFSRGFSNGYVTKVIANVSTTNSKTLLATKLQLVKPSKSVIFSDPIIKYGEVYYVPK